MVGEVMQVDVSGRSSVSELATYEGKRVSANTDAGFMATVTKHDKQHHRNSAQ